MASLNTKVAFEQMLPSGHVISLHSLESQMLDFNFLISYGSVSGFPLLLNLPFHWMGQCGTSQFKHYNHCGVAPFILNATFFV